MRAVNLRIIDGTEDWAGSDSTLTNEEKLEIRKLSYGIHKSKLLESGRQFDIFIISDKDSKVMEPRDYIPPSEYDVLLSDVKHNDLVGYIADKLDVKYLQEVPNMEQKSVEGTLYGSNLRPMINLIVASKRFRKYTNVIFLIDTGSPCLYICDKAMRSLGFGDHVPPTFDILFNGITHEAVMSPLTVDGRDGHYKDINLIGATFLSKMRTKVEINYFDNTVSMTFG